nr:fad-dependent monooxygenase nscc [Quercus suber]
MPALENVECVEMYKPGGYHPVNLGDVLGRKYKVIHKLGHGGFAIVWLARDVEQHQYVALKILRADAPPRERTVLKQIQAATTKIDLHRYANVVKSAVLDASVAASAAAAAASVQSPKFRDVLGRKYKVIHKLGHGGFAIVWLARDVEQHQYVALKILRADAPPRERTVLKQIQAATTKNIPIATLHEEFAIHGPNGVHQCLVMDVGGPSLRGRDSGNSQSEPSKLGSSGHSAPEFMDAIGIPEREGLWLPCLYIREGTPGVLSRSNTSTISLEHLQHSRAPSVHRDNCITYESSHTMSAPSGYGPKHALAGKRIVVAGAGIAGLAFVRALDRAWPTSDPKPEVVLYERSTEHQDVRRNGYTMGIKGFGLEALRDLDLFDDAVKKSTASSMPTIWSRGWTTLLEPGAAGIKKGASTPHSYRLVRHVLRDLLVDALPESQTVNWELGCESARVLGDGRVEVKLSNGAIDTCDLLIAADGANSKIRQALLPHATLEFAGAVCCIATSRFPAGKPGVLKEKWGILLSGLGSPFLAFPIDAHNGVWSVSWRAKEPAQRIRGEEAVARKDEILDEVKRIGRTFGEPFAEFVDATDPDTLQKFNAMHRYPIVHAQELPHANVVLIGDANHPMSPFSGNGANSALKDAVELARRLAEHTTGMHAAIDDFDRESVPRSRTAIDQSWWMIRILHCTGPVYWLLRTLMAAANFVFHVRG